jgi:hypothetical protein
MNAISLSTIANADDRLFNEGQEKKKRDAIKRRKSNDLFRCLYVENENGPFVSKTYLRIHCECPWIERKPV